MDDTKNKIYINKINMIRSHCSNCGRHGHNYKCCIDPITSIGVICFKIENMDNTENTENKLNIKNIFSDLSEMKDGEFVKLKYVKGIPLEFIKLTNNTKQNDEDVITNTTNLGNTIDYNHIDNNQLMNIFNKYHNTVKFLLVQRKYSLGYIVFMKGKWNSNNKEEMINMFIQMTKNEIEGLLEKSESVNGFESLWEQFWDISYKESKIMSDSTTTTTISSSSSYIYATKKKYDREFNILKKKFELLISATSWNLKYYCNLVYKYGVPEWGFPKGKREHKEDNMNCALREFEEETGINKSDLCLLKKVRPLQEDMIGTNKQEYRHLYYIGFTDNIKVVLNPKKHEAHRNEIGDVGWYSYMEVIKLLNEKHRKKIYILTQIFLFIIMRLLKNETLSVAIKS